MRKFLWIILLLFAAIGAPNAHAQTFDWSYTCETSGCTDNASGTLTTGAFSGGVATILSITGTYDGSAITGLLAPRTCCASELNDNLLYFPGTPYLDIPGLGLAVGSLDLDSNIFFDDGTYGDDTCISGNNCSTDYTHVSSGIFTAEPTPEPSTFSLVFVAVAAGLISLGFKRRSLRSGSPPTSAPF
jgi:hypothetical protein